MADNTRADGNHLKPVTANACRTFWRTVTSMPKYRLSIVRRLPCTTKCTLGGRESPVVYLFHVDK
jgi:hypothetical protein